MPKFAGLLSRVDDCFAALDAYRQGDADQIVDLYAPSALEALAQAGIVTAAQLDKRTRAWRAPDVLDLLDEFAERRRRA